MRGLSFMAVALITVVACTSSDVHSALCDAVERLVETREEADRSLGRQPGADDVAASFRNLSARYGEVADALEGDDAAGSTLTLASLYERGAKIFEDHAGAGPDALERRSAESETLVALRERMAGGRPLGFSQAAWAEIDAECDPPVDPLAR